MLEQEEKREIIKKFARHDKDTGSPEVQIALFTERIKQITEHLKEHPKDFSSRRGLIKLVGQRNALLKYISKNKKDIYNKLIEELGLKK
ncbi:MAG: 30S ribosomal protein S15 [Planctomycetota bacterium]